MTVLQERNQDRPLLAGVLDRLAEQALGPMSSTLEPRERQGVDVFSFPRVRAVGLDRFRIAGHPDEQIQAALCIVQVPELTKRVRSLPSAARKLI